jgi:hypothetical protein
LNTDTKELKNEPSKVIKVILFWSNWLLAVFLSKQITSSPKGNIDFFIKNLASFICAAVVTGIMLHFFSGKVLKIMIVLIWITTILAAVI